MAQLDYPGRKSRAWWHWDVHWDWPQGNRCQQPLVQKLAHLYLVMEAAKFDWAWHPPSPQ